MDMMGYKNRDEVCCSPDKLPNYDEKLKMFFAEHIHEDEEIRLIKDGMGYFDVRDAQDRWVRIDMRPGDLIILPAGIYHRFTMGESNFTQAIRLFKDAPSWTPVNRPCEDNKFRQDYLSQFITNPPVKETPVGPVNGKDNFYLSHPDRYDATVKEILGKLNPETQDILIMYFTGTPNPATGKSWCPDCVVADPVLEEMVKTARAQLTGTTVAFLQCTVDRNSYFRHPDTYLYKKHPFIGGLPGGIPTVLVTRFKSGADEEADGEGGIEIVTKMDSSSDSGNPEITLDWIEKCKVSKA